MRLCSEYLQKKTYNFQVPVMIFQNGKNARQEILNTDIIGNVIEKMEFVLESSKFLKTKL